MQTFLFIAFPYIALILAVGVGLYRYFSHRFTYSSVSSQLLENRHLFWGSVSWHYGITLILLAHVLPWLFPRAAAALLGELHQPRAVVQELRVAEIHNRRSPARPTNRAPAGLMAVAMNPDGVRCK